MTGVRIAGLLALGGLAMLCACSSPVRPLTALTIVSDPGSLGSVEEAARSERRVNWWDGDARDDDACTMAFAATELQRFLPASLGLPSRAIRLASAVPDTGDVIVLSLEPTGTRAGSSSALGPQSFRLHASEARGRRRIDVEGGDRAGVLYGAYALIEALGTSFLGLGDTGTVTPSKPVPWPRRLDHEEHPAIETRGFWAFEPRGDARCFEWMARNRLNQWTAVDTAYVPLMKKLGFRLTGGGHDVQAAFLPPAHDFTSHPEWYALRGGRRSARLSQESGDNFCTSNVEARGTLAQRVVQSLIDGKLEHVDLLELWTLDGGQWCECDSCRAQGSPTDRWLDVAETVADSLEQARVAGRLTRPVMLSTLAYLETLAPPQRRHGEGVSRLQITFCPYFRCYAHALEDSTCTEINRRLAAAWKGWVSWRAGTHAAIGLCEYYNVGAFKSLPLVFPHVMARDLGTARRAPLERIEYMHAPTRAWGSWTLAHRLFSRLAWGPDQDADSLVEGFCREFYPGAATAMREHDRALERASANILALQHCVGVYGTSVGGRLTQPAARLFPLRHLQSRETHPATDDGPDLDEIESAMVEARAALERAKSLAADPVERARLREDEQRFAYGESMFAFDIALIRTAERERAGDPDGARAAFAAARRAAEKLRQVSDLVQVSASHANARDGLEASGVKSTFEAFGRRYGR